MEPEQTWAGVEKILEHPEYNGDVLNDIAVLRLAQEVADPTGSTFSIFKIFKFYKPSSPQGGSLPLLSCLPVPALRHYYNYHSY